jgi:hypothetical protein
MVTEYFERPCPKYPDGRHLVIANRRQVVPEAKYPLRDRDGTVIDEPVPHRLAWDLDGGAHRDFGLTWQLIDAQRTAQDCRNKAVEWKNRCLIRSGWARELACSTRSPTSPARASTTRATRRRRRSRPKPIPDSLFRLVDRPPGHAEIGFDTQLDAAPDVAARTIQAVVEQADLQWAQFLIHKADWWSPADAPLPAARVLPLHRAPAAEVPRPRRVGAHQGLRGRAADGRGRRSRQPASLATLTRSQVRDMLDWIATRFPGWLNPQDALAALQTPGRWTG